MCLPTHTRRFPGRPVIFPPLHYRLVMFDFDGTLVDSFPWFCGILNELAAEFKFPPVSAGQREMLRNMETSEILKQMGIPLWKLPAIAMRMRQWAGRDLRQLRLFPGIPEMLADLRGSGLSLGIVTSNAEANVREVLGPKTASLVNFYSCGTSMFGKSSRIKAVARAAGVSTAEAIYIGDETRDAEASSKAGVDFGAVGWGYSNLSILQRFKPRMIFHEVGDLPQSLRR